MPGAEKQILVVEDDVELCNSILTSLHLKKYKCIGVTEVREASLRLKNQKFDAILLDMRLGSGDSGEELITFVRERKGSMNVNTPIIVISGFLDKPLVQKIAPFIQGALVKPFEMAALLEAIKKQTGE